jgi:hypothetical protein
VKNQVAVEVQFGKYAFVAFALFVKHLLLGEVYNVMRHGRNNPPVPLLILGV